MLFPVVSSRRKKRKTTPSLKPPKRPPRIVKNIAQDTISEVAIWINDGNTSVKEARNKFGITKATFRMVQKCVRIYHKSQKKKEKSKNKYLIFSSI